VIAFNTCGLPDIVEHLQTGYLAKAFDTTDLAHGIQWLLSDRSRLMTLGLAARQRALDKWSVKVVAEAYQNVYDYVLLNN
jgi:glycosyltransferase involved in cell wall biosynthesis